MAARVLNGFARRRRAIFGELLFDCESTKYRRRLYEELLKPVVANPELTLAERCELARHNRPAADAESTLSDFDAAMAEHVRRDILPHFSVMAICQLLPESKHNRTMAIRRYSLHSL